MFYHILKKEFKLIFRDIHALLVLFIMPLVFILIMSIALKNSYSQTIETKLKVAIVTEQNKDIDELLKTLNQNPYFDISLRKESSSKALIYEDNFDFVVNIDSDFKTKIDKNDKNFTILIFSKPEVKSEFYYILKSEIVKSISKSITKEFYIEAKIDAKNLDNLDNLIQNEYLFKNQKESIKLNSTQQSVPAWLVFSMFFILIPISNTYINEKNFGTIQRIKSINTPLYLTLFGKILPYFIINQIQLFVMLLVGRFVIPLFNIEALSLDINIFLLLLCSFSISFAAICFALLIANISKTTEEATSIGGLINIIFAALAGVMVPKFIMPQFMQTIGEFSPMSWGLESFIEIMVRGGDFNDIKHYLFYLIVFGTICLFFSNLLLKKQEN
ncbi:ABC transporter [Aliarcobacter trophiarum LMG 25534]|uniref:ABC transporter n=1 Tax=Aliarcobacter trophiarum LMG 25534 TaxID=1032241 RepID=A0AAD0QJY6_9BACT|nr:ABC transporter permease [Aliarcobacter trophiarum]AXK49075.1 ABC transporter, permease protein [Aliarcobacter trophiarum LMG 25534]RXI28231.1 ABC transporter [Aliarcobacter trophiarum]RXJ90964.1 ABC transporter [Aliarcobacter trophiarum LMG 25534]